MTRGCVHTVQRADYWANEVEGIDHASSLHGTQDEAIRHGQAQAQNRGVEHVVHNSDGSVAERNTYGDEPLEERFLPD